MTQQPTQQPITDEQAMQALSRLRSASYQHLVASRAVHEECDEALARLVRYVQQGRAPQASPGQEEAEEG